MPFSLIGFRLFADEQRISGALQRSQSQNSASQSQTSTKPHVSNHNRVVARKWRLTDKTPYYNLAKSQIAEARLLKNPSQDENLAPSQASENLAPSQASENLAPSENQATSDDDFQLFSQLSPMDL